MKKKKKVLFNASVIIAGLISKKGGSAKIINMSATGKISGFVSEIVLDEVKRHSKILNLTQKQVENIITKRFYIVSAPEKIDEKYKKFVKDLGDIHLFTTAQNNKANYMVSLDQKHVLSLSKKIKKFKIVAPCELIAILENK